jgi:predicted hydrolase (HD superfamily)
MEPTREAAWTLLTTYTETESLQRHALSVEAVMRHFARKAGEDEEKWGIIGLVHDLDWEKFPEEHCAKTREILTEAGWPEEYIRSIMSHAWGFVTDVKPEHYMEKVLYATDELTGLITATALMRPSKSVLDMKVKSVKKKWKEKSFAAGVDREVVAKGAEMLGMELTDLFEETIAAMRTVADEIGLRGTPAEE